MTEQATNAGGFVGHDAYWQAVVGLTWSFDFTTVPAIRSQEAAADAARAREQRARLAARDGIENAWKTVGTNIARSRSARTQAEVSAEASTRRWSATGPARRASSTCCKRSATRSAPRRHAFKPTPTSSTPGPSSGSPPGRSLFEAGGAPAPGED